MSARGGIRGTILLGVLVALVYAVPPQAEAISTKPQAEAIPTKPQAEAIPTEHVANESHDEGLDPNLDMTPEQIKVAAEEDGKKEMEMIDTNKDGKASMKELEAFMQLRYYESEIHSDKPTPEQMKKVQKDATDMMQELDTDSSGDLNVEEITSQYKGEHDEDHEDDEEEDEEDEWADEAEGNNTQNEEPEPDAVGTDDKAAQADTVDDNPDEDDTEDGAVSQLEDSEFQ